MKKTMNFHDFPRFPSHGWEVSHLPPKVMCEYTEYTIYTGWQVSEEWPTVGHFLGSLFHPLIPASTVRDASVIHGQ